MWIHILLFFVLAGFAIAGKVGWLKLDGFGGKKGKQLFFLVAFCGNVLGLCLTLSNREVRDSQMLIKSEDMTYEQKMQVTVEDGESGALYLQIPEKETEAEKAEEEQADIEKESSWKQDLRDMVTAYNEEKGDPDYYYLPDQWNGKKLEWEYPVNHTGNLIAGLGFLMAVMVLIKKAREEEEARIRKYEELLLDYPGLIMKFTLLIQAGMTVRKAFQKMASDYRRKEKKKKRVAYGEILVTCYEMESGVSEAEAYRRFGERCGQMKYKTFATLLIQNLQKGSRHLAEMLEAESIEAWEERKRRARVQGEVASTKLLLPMIMMLMVVMALIMIPAFLSFYG